jgi:hypothetical protein
LPNTPDLSRREFLTATTAAFVAGGVQTVLPVVARAAPPVWSGVPGQTWTVGVPVLLRLADYVTDADGDPLTFSLDQSLPPGLTLSNGIISGVPTGEFVGTYVATASHTSDTLGPSSPMGLQLR